MSDWEHGCEAMITMPVESKRPMVKMKSITKMEKEIPELAEFLETAMHLSASITTHCTLKSNHEGPHHFVLKWIDPSES